MQVIATMEDTADLLRDYAYSTLRDYNLPTDAEIAASIISHPAFFEATAYHVAFSASNKRVVGTCLRRRWDARKDMAAFNNPIERLRFLNGYKLSFDETRVAQPTFDQVAFLHDLMTAPAKLPPFTGQRSIVIDGYFCELTLRSCFSKTVFAWNNKGPIEWMDITEAH